MRSSLFRFLRSLQTSFSALWRLAGSSHELWHQSPRSFNRPHLRPRAVLPLLPSCGLRAWRWPPFLQRSMRVPGPVGGSLLRCGFFPISPCLGILRDLAGVRAVTTQSIRMLLRQRSACLHSCSTPTACCCRSRSSGPTTSALIACLDTGSSTPKVSDGRTWADPVHSALRLNRIRARVLPRHKRPHHQGCAKADQNPLEHEHIVIAP